MQNLPQYASTNWNITVSLNLFSFKTVQCYVNECISVITAESRLGCHTVLFNDTFVIFFTAERIVVVLQFREGKRNESEGEETAVEDETAAAAALRRLLAAPDEIKQCRK